MEKQKNANTYRERYRLSGFYCALVCSIVKFDLQIYITKYTQIERAYIQPRTHKRIQPRIQLSPVAHKLCIVGEKIQPRTTGEETKKREKTHTHRE